MVGTYLTPGVYVEELPSGSRAIEGVSTSNTLFIGYTRRGPVAPPGPGDPPDLAVRISSWSEYVDTFGGVVDGQSRGINDYREARLPQDVDLMGHVVFAYFQNGGSIAYIRRMARDLPGAGDDDPGQPLARSRLSLTGTTPSRTFVAVDPGRWADGLEIQVTSDVRNPDRFVMVVGRRDDTDRFTALERFEGVGLAEGDAPFIGDVLEQRSDLVRLGLDDGGEPDEPDAAFGLFRAVHRSGDISGVGLDLSGASDAERTIRARFDPGSTAQTPAIVARRIYDGPEGLARELQAVWRASTDPAEPDPAIRSSIEVRVVPGGEDAADEVYLEVSAAVPDPSLNAIATVTADGLGDTLQFDPDDAVRSHDREATSGTMAGGGDGTFATAQDYVAAFQHLRLNDDVNVIVTPNAAWDDDGRAIVEAARAHCENMRDRVLIIDPERGLELDDPITVASLGMGTSTYAQTYYPWVEVANPIHDPDLRPDAPRTVLVPPSGFAAGTWARTDTRRGVWKAPAGVETSLTGPVGFEFIVGDPQQEILNPEGINVLRSRPGYGNVIWGTRTLSTRANPEWRYIPVRRTAIMIEKALREGIQWAVFEPNNHQLWSSLRLAAEVYMDGLFRSGAFQGAKASDAFGVDCGLGSTMTQGDIDRGYVLLRVGFAPLKPAEFVVIQIRQLVGQS